MKTSLAIKVTAITAALALAGCATHPNAMQASYISPNKYSGYQCDQIGAEMERVDRRTNELYNDLESENQADRAQFAVGMVLFWPALFFLEGGDDERAAEYSQLKGEFAALEQTSTEKRCGMDAESLDADFHDLVKESESYQAPVAADCCGEAVTDQQQGT